jgi:hypothetical protein
MGLLNKWNENQLIYFRTIKIEQTIKTRNNIQLLVGEYNQTCFYVIGIGYLLLSVPLPKN